MDSSLEYYEPTERDPMLAKRSEVLKDRGWFIYGAILINGIGILLPWNMFITIAPQYYADYWFTRPNGGNQTSYATNFMSSLGIASHLPNLSVNVINIFVVFGGSLLFRIFGPLCLNCVIIGIVLSLIVLVEPSLNDMEWFYIVTLVIVVILNASNGMYQNSIFGLAADFPFEYTNAVVVGNNVCGLFTTLLNLICTIIIPEEVKGIALLYFSISLIMLLICGAALGLATRRPFYKFYVEQGQRVREVDNTIKPSAQQYLQCFQKCWVQLYNVFITYFITLTIFPAMMSSTPLLYDPSAPWPSVIPEQMFTTLTTFLNFNFFALVGSISAGKYQWPSEKHLWIPVTMRVLFVPFFAFCNYRPVDRKLPVVFTSEWMFVAGGAVMAFTHGYFSSLAMMYAPKVVQASLSKIAGMISATCLIFGLFAGVSFTFVVAAIITWK